MRHIVPILFLFFLPSLLFGADFNSTIIHGNTKVYSALYQKLSTLKQKSDEISLQKTLLHKLIGLENTKTPKEQNLATPTNQKSYLHLFDTFIQSAIEEARTKQALQITANKIETLDRQIKDQNSTTLTTQLFYALYTKEQQQTQDNLSRLKQKTAHIKSLLLRAIQHITFDPKAVENARKKVKNALQKLNTSTQQLLIKKERYTLMNQEKMIQHIQKQLDTLKNRQSRLARQKLQLLFLRFSIALQKKSDETFALHKQILAYLHSFISMDPSVSDEADDLLTQMEKQIFGTVSTMKGIGFQELKTQAQQIWSIANQPLFTINKTPVSVVKLLVSLLIFIIGFIIGNFYKKQIKRISSKNRAVTSSTRTLLANLGSYVIFIITFFIVLKVLGIDLSSIALVAGALSVGIGFGLQNIISNFVSGIILMVERSVRIGDYIQLDNDIRGHVVDIKMRSITVNTNSNIDVIIPNQDLIQNRVINWTMNDKIRRFEIPFGVAYGTDPQKVIDVVLEAVKKSNFNDIYITQERHTRVIMTGMGDSSVNFALFVWLVGREILFPKRTTSRFLILIYNALYANGIEIPFPQQDIHIRSIDTALPLTIKKESTT